MIMKIKKNLLILPLLALPLLTSCDDNYVEIEISKAEFLQDRFNLDEESPKHTGAIVQYCSESYFLFFEGDYDFSYDISFSRKFDGWYPAEYETSEYAPEIAVMLNTYSYSYICKNAENLFPGFELKYFGIKDFFMYKDIPSYSRGNFVQYYKKDSDSEITRSIHFDQFGLLSAYNEVIKKGANNTFEFFRFVFFVGSGWCLCSYIFRVIYFALFF